MIRAALIALVVMLCLACGGREPPYHVETVRDGLSSPVFAAIQPGTNGRLVVVEQGGRVIALDGSVLLDLRRETEEDGERGLLGLAFHPDYPRDDRVFVDLTDRSDGATRILEIHLPVGGTASKPTELLRIEQPYANHNGGMLAFAADGLLYIGTGDGGSAGDPENRAQDPSNLLGKILRLDVDRAGSRPGVWALGLRNPWRFSFDRATGDLWIGDVGQNEREEIDVLPAGTAPGANLGWRLFEGTRRYSDGPAPDGPAPDGLVAPVAEYSHDEGCSVTGGIVLRGDATPSLEGSYLYADYCSGRLWALAGSSAEPLELTGQLDAPLGAPVAFVPDGDGSALIVDHDGRLLRLVER